MADFSQCPAEVKNAIYGEIFGGDSKNRTRSGHGLAMFTVSKLLHTESASYFYENNVITLDIPSATTTTATILPPVADRYLRFLKRLTLHAHVAPVIDLEMCKVASAIKAVSCIGANLAELKVVLTSSLSHLLNSRVDDSVLDHTHPITEAVQCVLRANVAKSVCITLENAWFAPGVAQTLSTEFGSRIEFYQHRILVLDVATIERPLAGRYASQHLINLGLQDENLANLSHGRNPCQNHWGPSSLPSSLCSAFSNLDTFSVSSFESGSDDTEASDYDDSCKADVHADASEQPFFAEDDIEEWSNNTQDDVNMGEEDFEMDLDDELEDVPQDDVNAFMRNMDEVAHHKANELDIEYLTNFAPNLLLSRAQLSHII
ncbi:hypothetical protein DE146DRAFT_624441 [Phaeosphaeria sp. MPI-PUGE-AT-0046c]|nr:hypothetical protein DE146DRAFT_624441 [Phaeosphaeria sp. MPI-PUGE-AT-0046c]